MHVVFMDVSKAFEKNASVVKKMSFDSPNTCNVIKPYFTERNQLVKVKICYSAIALC